ncbi:M56 family metallopeptidase [Streptomyces sclerotialus]|uniref:M56 family metallopeptidase n=1 Tax=Streptomyces sclerotialus TaxID=1957 RepID=UPI0004C578B9
MLHHLVLPLGIALGSALLAPGLLARARWAPHAPRLAIASWLTLAVLMTAAVGLGLAQLLLPLAGAHDALALIVACATAEGGAAEPSGRLYLLLAGSLATAALPPVQALAREHRRTRRARTRHADLLRLVGRRSAPLGAVVIDHAVPTVYCLPGRSPQIVVSSGAVRTLSKRQLDVALAHERAHLRGRHHWLGAAARAFGTSFRWLPLGRRLLREVPLLLEMAADDRALRHGSRQALAAALYEMAAGQAAQGTLSLSGSSTAVRVRRLLTTERPRRAAARGALTVLGCGLAAAPLLVTCCVL